MNITKITRRRARHGLIAAMLASSLGLVFADIGGNGEPVWPILNSMSKEATASVPGYIDGHFDLPSQSWLSMRD
jgi:hypothetical protein